MLIDCDGCRVRGAGCAGCLVTALLDTDSPAAGLGVAEHRAIEVLTRAGFEVEVLAHETRPARSTRRRVA
ncbi:hypothetical protein ACWDUH_18450 [Micromonospora wenchangensis]|uniref:Uncharacterized protein n=1 Tax=Micromonospora wenchangensis TaxID=1185415 RepID=A0A246RKZ3_9ACTN|nr:hypothetical protein [Micromonospora wenchangensis]OWV06553.1 hypothetical protein B5D80_16060 [Micromonospora wenchangensis]